jgi:hypothetical protein
MGYPKRQSAPLAKAQDRLRGLQTIHPDLELGYGLTLPDYATLIDTVDRQLQVHNDALAATDRTRIELTATEATLSDLSSRILTAIVARYGKESKEYEMAGGTPPSRAKRAKKAAAAEPAQAESGAPVTRAAIANGNGVKLNGAIAR